jgi:Uma2 family endonuclease
VPLPFSGGSQSRVILVWTTQGKIMNTAVLAAEVDREQVSSRQPSRGVTCTFVLDDEVVHVPAWVVDHASFRRWVHSEEFPERTGRICYLNGEVWIDMSTEQFFSHNQLKNEYSFTLTGVVKAGRLGRFIPDGMLISNDEAGLTAQPDGAFASQETLRTGRLRLVEGKKEGYIELEGTPDMVLEILSDSSVRKDTVKLRELYWKAGIPEYWLVDARGEKLVFDILRRGPKGYTPVSKKGGWLKSAVFGKSFRLTRQTDELGNPEYTLEVR